MGFWSLLMSRTIMNRQRLDSPLVYVGAHNVYYVKLPVKVLYFTIHIHTQINQYVVISDFPPVSVEKFNLCSVMAHHRPWVGYLRWIGSNTASGLGIEILDGNMRPVKLNDLHAGMQWIPLVPDQNNILPYSARLKSTQKSVNPGLVSASATFTLEFQ